MPQRPGMITTGGRSSKMCGSPTVTVPPTSTPNTVAFSVVESVAAPSLA